MKDLLETVEKQTGFRFTYSNLEIADRQIIEIPQKIITIGSIINQIAIRFKTEYSIYNYSVVFAKFEPPGSAFQGTVRDEEGQPIPGVMVCPTDDPDRIYYSDCNGQFKIGGLKDGSRLRFSQQGYEPLIVLPIIEDKPDIILRWRKSELKAVIVRSYAPNNNHQLRNFGIIETRYSTQGLSSISEILKGQVTGLLVTEANGAVGSGSRFQLRGQQSIGLVPGAINLPVNNPLLLLNGVPWFPMQQSLSKLPSMAGDPGRHAIRGGINMLEILNPADIEKIEVLKDVDAIAIYGSRGTHGVINIITKKVLAGNPKYTFKASKGISVAAYLPGMMNTEQFARFRRQAIDYADSAVNPHTAKELFLWPLSRNTDWPDFLLGNTGSLQQYHFSMSDESKTGNKFYLGAGFDNESSILPLQFSSRKGNVLLNTSLKVGNHINTTFTAYLSAWHNELPSYDPMYLTRLAPHAPALTDKDGNLVLEENGLTFSNPLAALKNKYESRMYSAFGHLQSAYRISRHFQFRVKLGLSAIQFIEKGIYSNQPNTSPHESLVSIVGSRSKYQHIFIAPQLQYFDSTRIRKSSLSVHLGSILEIQNHQWNLGYNNKRSSNKLSNRVEPASLAPEYFRYNYTGIYMGIHLSFQDKYLVNLTGRMDGSNRIGPGKPFALFGTLGAGWIFLPQQKFRDRIISYGKLRASIGISGNDDLGNYNNFTSLQTGTKNSYNDIAPVYSAKIDNPGLEWERNLKTEIAADFRLLDFLSATVAWYHSKSSNLLIAGTLPGVSGASFQYPINHDAVVLNSGFELSLEINHNLGRGLAFSSSFHFTLPRNKLQSFKDLSSSVYRNTLAIGESLSVLKGYVFKGVDHATGSSEFQDMNRDGMINIGDLIPIGNLDPVLYGGWSNRISYKQWEFSLFMEGRIQNKINPLLYYYQYNPGSFRTDLLTNLPTAFINSWTKNGSSTSIPGLSAFGNEVYNISIDQLRNSNLILTDGSYLRIKSIMVSWKTPEKFLSRLRIPASKIHLRLFNPFLFTRYKWGDPTIQYPTEIPSIRSLVLGLDLRI